MQRLVQIADQMDQQSERIAFCKRLNIFASQCADAQIDDADNISTGSERMTGGIVIATAMQRQIDKVPVAVVRVYQVTEEVLRVGVGVNRIEPEVVFVLNVIGPGCNT